MIRLTRLGGQSFVLNSELIEFVDETPDTVVSLTTGKKIIVVESIDELIEKIVEYKRKTCILPNLNEIHKDEV